MSNKEIKFRTAYGPKVVVGLDCGDEVLTKQCFVAECDVNNIVRKWLISGELPLHGNGGYYGDFADIGDYQSAVNAVMDAEDAFMNLPARVRAEFENDPAKLLNFLQDPSNVDKAVELGLVERPIASSTDEVPVEVPGSVG